MRKHRAYTTGSAMHGITKYKIRGTFTHNDAEVDRVHYTGTDQQATSFSAKLSLKLLE